MNRNDSDPHYGGRSESRRHDRSNEVDDGFENRQFTQPFPLNNNNATGGNNNSVPDRSRRFIDRPFMASLFPGRDATLIEQWRGVLYAEEIRTVQDLITAADSIPSLPLPLIVRTTLHSTAHRLRVDPRLDIIAASQARGAPEGDRRDGGNNNNDGDDDQGGVAIGNSGDGGGRGGGNGRGAGLTLTRGGRGGRAGWGTPSWSDQRPSGGGGANNNGGGDDFETDDPFGRPGANTGFGDNARAKSSTPIQWGTPAPLPPGVQWGAPARGSGDEGGESSFRNFFSGTGGDRRAGQSNVVNDSRSYTRDSSALRQVENSSDPYFRPSMNRNDEPAHFGGGGRDSWGGRDGWGGRDRDGGRGGDRGGRRDVGGSSREQPQPQQQQQQQQQHREPNYQQDEDYLFEDRRAVRDRRHDQLGPIVFISRLPQNATKELLRRCCNDIARSDVVSGKFYFARGQALVEMQSPAAAARLIAASEEQRFCINGVAISVRPSLQRRMVFGEDIEPSKVIYCHSIPCSCSARDIRDACVAWRNGRVVRVYIPPSVPDIPFAALVEMETLSQSIDLVQAAERDRVQIAGRPLRIMFSSAYEEL